MPLALRQDTDELEFRSEPEIADAMDLTGVAEDSEDRSRTRNAWALTSGRGDGEPLDGADGPSSVDWDKWSPIDQGTDESCRARGAEM